MANKVKKLGWVRDLPDPRDHRYSAPLGVLLALPASVDLAPKFPVYDQGKIGSCTANALAAAVQFDREKSGQTPDFVPSRLFHLLQRANHRRGCSKRRRSSTARWG